MKKIAASILSLSILGISYSDELILKKKGSATYIQKEEFMVAEGENIVGPIFILPVANINGLVIEGNDISVAGYVIEGNNRDWKDVLKGRIVSIEGEGRFIRGEVVNIKDNRIMIDTRKGFVVTTLPEFPSRLSSSQKWRELFSPRITLKISAKKAETKRFTLRYPVTGLNWNINYILSIKNNEKRLEGYIQIVNNTPMDLENINVKLIDKRKVLKELHETTLPAFSRKKVLFYKGDFPASTSIPDGIVSVYRDGVFMGIKRIVNGNLK